MTMWLSYCWEFIGWRSMRLCGIETKRTPYAGVGACVKAEDKCGWCRRIIVQDRVSLAAGSETDVTGQLVYRDFKTPGIPGLACRMSSR